MLGGARGALRGGNSVAMVARACVVCAMPRACARAVAPPPLHLWLVSVPWRGALCMRWCLAWARRVGGGCGVCVGGGAVGRRWFCARRRRPGHA